jgi:PucR C-terminal helix-turn-helix domain
MRVRELAEVSRPETLPISGPISGPVSGAAFSAETAAVVRARLGGAIPEMIEAIAAGVPEYASRAHPGYRQRLADWAGPEPCLLVPDPDGPGRQAAIDRALRGLPAAIGPSVPLVSAAMSLRWARHALALARAGIIPAGLVRCEQHLSTLLILADEDLAAALRDRRLAPLAQLRPGQRDRIAETLLAWLQLGENATEVAQRIHVHPQTVRYRLRQIQELFGDQLRDPDRRFELHLALRIRTLSASVSHTKAGR